MTAMSTVPMSAGRYLHWGVINVSLTNLLIIVAMIVVFALAILVPFGRSRESDEAGPRRES